MNQLTKQSCCFQSLCDLKVHLQSSQRIQGGQNREWVKYPLLELPSKLQLKFGQENGPVCWDKTSWI